MRFRKLTLGLGTAAVAVAALGAIPALGADHRDAPITKESAKLDINDLYAFKSGNNLVIAMTVNPLTSPANTGALSLDTDAVYQFKLDGNGDAIADQAIKLTFAGSGPVQDVTVYNATGSAASTNDASGTMAGQGRTSAGSGVTAFDTQAGKVFVGPRDDPFFFDLAGFQDGLNFTGVDTFKGTNVTAIVVEIPAASVAALSPSGALGVWATTNRPNSLGVFEQIDRMGRPAINTVFIPADQKDAFNQNGPDKDVSLYTDEVKAALDSLGSPSTDDLAGLLLPDILTINTAQSVGYLNGRDLDDDVIDISLQAITGNSAATDKVNANDKAFSTSFPYLAAPHGQAAPGAPNTGTGLQAENEGGMDLEWTLPAGLLAAATLLATAGLVERRRTARDAR